MVNDPWSGLWSIVPFFVAPQRHRDTKGRTLVFPSPKLKIRTINWGRYKHIEIEGHEA